MEPTKDKEDINNYEKKVNKKKGETEEDLVEKYRRELLENTLRRRFFVIPAFEIYNGIAGLYDYGPTGCALKNNIEAYWREHFILEEDMLEISGTCLTPEIVLKTSGHVDRFTDYAVTDVKTGQCHRADKLIQQWIGKQKKKKGIKDEEIKQLNQLNDDVDKMDGDELDSTIKKYKIKSPDTGNDLSASFRLNLMFATQIGPCNGIKSYLRPETAQGHFVNFRKLLEFNGGRIPFASASIGLGFRNEISPRQGLLRVREFTMAEIEHYVDPENKTHKKFDKVKDMVIPLWSKDNQKEGLGVIRNKTLGEAVQEKMIDNETLAYFLARTYLFLTTIGINKEGVRFRQHTEKEMAHYASDCWDAEVETSYGWIEVAGHADRTCYDLTNHQNESGVELVASKPLKEPLVENKIRFTLNKAALYKNNKDKEKCNKLVKYLETVSATKEGKAKLFAEFKYAQCLSLNIEGDDWKLTKEYVTLEEYQETLYEEKYIPGVIEPSFGIGRIVYCVMEHCYKVRDTEKTESEEKQKTERSYFSFPPVVAPYKVSVLPLIHSKEMLAYVEPIRKILVHNGISYKIDEGGDSVGWRYFRTDEIGVPFGITIDNDTLKDDTVTLREIMTMKQIRIPYKEVGDVIKRLTTLVDTWENVMTMYPLFEHKGKEK